MDLGLDLDMDLGLDLLRKTTAALCLDERPLAGLSAVGIDQDVVLAHTILYIILFDVPEDVRIVLADMPFYYVGATRIPVFIVLRRQRHVSSAIPNELLPVSVKP